MEKGTDPAGEERMAYCQEERRVAYATAVANEPEVVAAYERNVREQMAVSS